MPEDIPLAEQPGRLAGPAVWQTDERLWELFYGAIFVAGLLVVGATAGSAASRYAGLAVIAVMAPWYLLLGRRVRGTVTADRVSVSAAVYVTGIALLFAVAVVLVPNTWFLGFAIFPHTFEVLPLRRALIPVIGMNLVAAFSVAWHQRTAAGIVTAVAFAVFAVAFTLAFGNYITRIIIQSEERAELIGQLEATRAELAEVSREAGALAERQRLAGDIHDTLAQGFSSILMLIQAADAQLEQHPDVTATARAQLELAAQTARDNLAEARTLVGGLAPAVLQAGTLEDALRRITERAGAELGITTSFSSDGTGRRLPAATEVVLLRTGQEALANVRKHAAARSVAVQLRYAADRVRLEVSDDGAGFDPALVNGGYGLSGMRARVDEAGGTVEVRSAPAQGTSVLVEVPA
jgi:signal transduction histidine kinase